MAISIAALAAPAHAEKIANSYICVFKNDRVAKADVPDRANSAARAHGGAVSHVYRTAIRGFAANISETGMNAMRRNNPSIAYCEQVNDYVSRRLFNDILDSEEEHVDWLETQLDLIARGMSNRQIGDELHLTEGTVKGYVSTILAKLKLEDRTQAALYALRSGFLQLDSA